MTPCDLENGTIRLSHEKLFNSGSCPWSPYLRILKPLAKKCRKYSGTDRRTPIDGHHHTFGSWETTVNLDAAPFLQGQVGGGKKKSKLTPITVVLCHLHSVSTIQNQWGDFTFNQSPLKFGLLYSHVIYERKLK